VAGDMGRLPRNERLCDLAAASPLILYFLFVSAGLALQIQSQIKGATFSDELVLSVTIKAAGAIFAVTQIVFLVIRRIPAARFSAWWPRIIAVIGGNAPLLFLMLPAAAPHAGVSLASAALLILGTLASIFVLCWLGRSFSVTPQARALVVSGPYRFIRHPLYLSEQIIILGAMFQYRQPWAFVIFAASMTAQVPRMHYEELILTQTFPRYRAYAGRTARLVPGIY